MRGYLAERFDLAAVRGVVEDPTATATRRRCGRPRASRAGSPSPCPRSTTGWGSAWSRRRSSPGRWARGWRRVRGGAPCSRPRRSGSAGSDEQKAAWLPRLAAGDAVGALASRGTAPGLLPAVEYGAIADVVVAPTRQAGHGRVEHAARLVRRHGAPGRRHRGDRRGRCPARPPRSGPRSGPGPPSSSPPTWSASPARRSPAPSPTTVTASSSACRSAPSRRSSTRWPTCTSPSRWPSTPCSTPRTRSTPAARAMRRARRGRRQGQGGRRGGGEHRRDDPVPRRHRVHVGARGAPVLQARQAAGRASGATPKPTAPASRSSRSEDETVHPAHSAVSMAPLGACPPVPSP